MIWLFLACSHPVAPPDCTTISVAPLDVAEAERARVGGQGWTNVEVRVRYLCEVARIGPAAAAWKAEGRPADERARLAYQMRHNARMLARAMMPDQDEVARLEARDMGKYGTKDGPTFEWLVDRAKAKGLEGDAIYESIVESAQVTDADVNRALGLE